MSDFAKGALRKVGIFAAFTYCFYASTVLFLNYLFWAKFGRDFSVYWRAANQPLGEVYFWQGEFPFPYAPTMLLWVQPLRLGEWWPSYLAFAVLSAAALVWAVRPYLSKAMIALALLAPPTVRGLLTGQVCALLSAAMIWACGTPNRAAAGAAFGAVATVKPQLVIMAPLMFILNRDWRAFVWSGYMFLAIVILSLGLFGPARWPEWLASMDHFHSAVADTSVINIAANPAAIAESMGLAPVPFLIVGTFAGALLVYSCRDAEPLEKATAIGIGSIMAAPYALAYDLTIAMPFLALCVFRGRLLAVLALATPHQPLPALIAAYELTRTKLSTMFGWLRSSPQSRDHAARQSRQIRY